MLNYKHRPDVRAQHPSKIRNLSPSYEKCVREKVSRELRREVLEKNSHKCYCCNMRDREKGKRLELHHIVPVSLGGKTEENNLLPLCFNCHKSVHKVIDSMHLQPANFKRLALEDAVLQIAELRARERAGKFGRMEPQTDEIMKIEQEPSQELNREQQVQFGLMLFVLSMVMSKKQYRIFRKEITKQIYLERRKPAA